ncbi:HAD hydrolase-like protein [Variovorax sp. E3]|uniref:HAD hydrolase-like protein n=1 Tax=Variovorax sp. E3 TaxID=1914993 RepID=UPI0035ADD0E1
MWVGKPHPLIYDACRERLAALGVTRICAVGDSLEHDVLGGSGPASTPASSPAGCTPAISRAPGRRAPPPSFNACSPRPVPMAHRRRPGPCTPSSGRPPHERHQHPPRLLPRLPAAGRSLAAHRPRPAADPGRGRQHLRQGRRHAVGQGSGLWLRDALRRPMFVPVSLPQVRARVAAGEATRSAPPCGASWPSRACARRSKPRCMR